MSVEELEKMFSPFLVGLGYHLYAVERVDRILRFLIEKSDLSGVTIDDCAVVSQQLSHSLLVEDVDYDTLEVSSPGTDRTLMRSEHFKRYQGCEIDVQLYRSPSHSRHHFKGVLHHSDDQGIQLMVGTQLFEWAFQDIQKARLIPQWHRHKEAV